MTSIELLKLVDPQLYYGKFIAGGVFPDGRPIDSFKTFSFKRHVAGGVSVGSALVRQGGVSIVCTIHARLSPITTEAPLVTEFELEEDEDKTLRCQLVPTRSLLAELCAREALFPKGALTSTVPVLEWKLTAHFRVLNSDGDLSSAAVAALIAAMSDTKYLNNSYILKEFLRLPVVHVENVDMHIEHEMTITPEDVQIEDDRSKWVALKMSAWPVASTFLLYQQEGGELYLLADPPSDVRPLCGAQCTIVVGEAQDQKSSKVVYVLRTSGPCTDDLLERMVRIAEKRHQSIVTALRQK